MNGVRFCCHVCRGHFRSCSHTACRRREAVEQKAAVGADRRGRKCQTAAPLCQPPVSLQNILWYEQIDPCWWALLFWSWREAFLDHALAHPLPALAAMERTRFHRRSRVLFFHLGCNSFADAKGFAFLHKLWHVACFRAGRGFSRLTLRGWLYFLKTKQCEPAQNPKRGGNIFFLSAPLPSAALPLVCRSVAHKDGLVVGRGMAAVAAGYVVRNSRGLPESILELP